LLLPVSCEVLVVCWMDGWMDTQTSLLKTHATQQIRGDIHLHHRTHTYMYICAPQKSKVYGKSQPTAMRRQKLRVGILVGVALRPQEKHVLALVCVCVCERGETTTHVSIHQTPPNLHKHTHTHTYTHLTAPKATSEHNQQVTNQTTHVSIH
jgi:hypothetical protein